MRMGCLALLVLVAIGCRNRPSTKHAPLPPGSDALAARAEGATLVYSHFSGEMRPLYIPDKTKKVASIAVGRATSSGVGDAVDGGSWAIHNYTYGKVTFDDGTFQEHWPITLVYDNWSGKLAAVEAH